MVRLRFIILLVVLASCSTSKVFTDYNTSTDFSKLTTFQFYNDNGANLNELDVDRITTLISKNLTNKGLVEANTPAFFIAFNTEQSVTQPNNTVGLGIGSMGRNGGFGVSGGIPLGGNKTNEALTIEFIDAKTNSLIWEATINYLVKQQRTPEQRVTQLATIVNKLLQKFPPK